MKLFHRIFTAAGRFFHQLFTQGIYFPVWVFRKIGQGIKSLGLGIWRHRRKLGYFLLAFAAFLTIANIGEEGIPETIILTTLGIIALFLFVDRFVQLRKVRQLSSTAMQAELHMLKNQINPHFFFNTLNNLYGLSVEKSDQAPEVILKL